jgi:hypothetical protein
MGGFAVLKTGSVSCIERAIEVRTNRDSKYGHRDFPEQFLRVPEIGDYIESTNGILKVCARTFCLNGSVLIEVT